MSFQYPETFIHFQNTQCFRINPRSLSSMDNNSPEIFKFQKNQKHFQIIPVDFRTVIIQSSRNILCAIKFIKTNFFFWHLCCQSLVRVLCLLRAIQCLHVALLILIAMHCIAHRKRTPCPFTEKNTLFFQFSWCTCFLWVLYDNSWTTDIGNKDTKSVSGVVTFSKLLLCL